MSGTENRSSEKPFTGKHMLASMVCFFGVIVAVNLTLAALASGSWTGLVVKNSYVASQKFNAHLQAGREQAALGWHSNLTYEHGGLRFDIADKAGAAIAADAVTVAIGRPAMEADDRIVTLERRADGGYASDETLGAGQWELRATARIGDRVYIRETRIFVSPQQAGSTGALKP